MSDGQEFSEISQLLTELLQEATGLRLLDLHHAGYWMRQNPSLVNVLSSLRRLTEIELQNLEPRVSRLINEMQSTPQKLVLGPSALGYIGGLETMPEESTVLDLIPLGGLSSVTYLAVLDRSKPRDVAEFARRFPSVRSFDIRFYGGTASRNFAVPVVEWPTLQYVRGPVSSFTEWRNATNIHLLELVDDPRVLERFRISDPSIAGPLDAPAVVTNIQPVALIAQLSSTSQPPFWQALLGYSSGGGSARLRYLNIELSDIYSYQTWGIDLARWWRKMSTAMETSGIICLEIRCSLRHDTKPQLDTGAGGADEFEDAQSLSETILRTLLANVRDTAPGIRYLSLDLRPADKESVWRDNFLDPADSQELNIPPELRWWRFDGPSGIRMVKALDPIRGERIAAYLRSASYDHSHIFSEYDVQF